MPKIVESNLIFNLEKNIFFKCISLTKIRRNVRLF